MRRRYFATFRLGATGHERPGLEEVFECCREWIFHPTHRLGEPDDFGYEPELNRDWELGQGHRVLVRSYQDDDLTAFGVSFQHPDREEEGLAWRTDICAGRDGTEESAVHVAVTLYAGHTEARMAPGRLPVSRPRIVRNLVSRFQAHAGRPLQREPRVIEDTDVLQFVEFLTDENRELPVLFCAALNQTDEPLVPVERLADQLVGLAHVYAGANRFTSFRLGEELGRALNTFNGSVRIYWPELTKSDRPFTHKLWVARNLVDREKAFHDEVLETLARVSTGRVAPSPIRWEEFERRRSARRIRELQEEGTDEELIEAYEEILADQDSELEALRQQVGDLREEAEDARRRAESWRLAWEESQQEDDETEPAVLDQAPPRSLEEAVERVRDEFGERVAFPLNAKSELGRSEFSDVEGFYEALRWLATSFWESKSGQRSIPDLDKACREACGFGYAPDQSEITMGQYPSYYETTWQGETVTLGPHLSRGSGKDPRHTIRIGFAWDDEAETVVVGYIGQHQRTRAT